MAYRVQVTEQADREIGEAFEFIAQDGVERAAAWLDRLQSRLDRLATHPNRCPLAPESGMFDLEIRQALHGPFRVLFVVRGKTVTVLHVRHGARKALNEPDEGEG